MFDALGPGYTLLRLDPAIDVAPLASAMHAAGVPFATVDVAGDDAPAYDRKLLILRTDQHVAWRGDAPPADAAALVDTLRGNRAA